ncbi:MAG: histone deacetylase [Candidatus Woesearchaeota archaeon]
MTSTLVLYSSDIENYCQHPLQTGKKIVDTVSALKNSHLPIDLYESDRIAEIEDIHAVHHPAYVDYIKRISESGGGFIGLDEESVIDKNTFNAALKSAGISLYSVEAILNDKYDSAFTLTMPAGHHAGRTYGGGLCIFNNLAIAAQKARKVGNLKRILAIDWDAHFGNGVYDIFHGDPNFYAISMHEYPIEEYPIDVEDGTLLDKGFTAFSLPALVKDDDYFMIFKELLNVVSERFNPELIMVSAGQDGHFADCWGTLSLTAGLYKKLAELVRNTANKYTEGKFVLYLEGGYGPAFTLSNLAIVSGITGKDINIDDSEFEGIETEDRKKYVALSQYYHGTENLKDKLKCILDKIGDTFV